MRRPRNLPVMLCLPVVLAAAARTQADIVNFVATLDPTQETPGNFTTASGSGTAMLDTASGPYQNFFSQTGSIRLSSI